MKPIVLNQSSAKSFDTCHRLFAWERLQRLTSPMPAFAPSLGTAIHSTLAAVSSGSTLEEALELGKERLRELVLPATGPKLPGDSMLLDDGFEILDRMVPAYYDYWGPQGKLWQPLGIELQFLQEVGEGTDVYLRGKADNLVTYMAGLYLADYKSAGRLDARDELKYELDMQLTAYIYGLTKQLSAESEARGGEPVIVRGAIIDWLIKTKVPQFNRAMFSRSYEELIEFEQEFVERAREIRERITRVTEGGENWKTVFYKNTESCFKWGRACTFRDLCLKDTPERRLAYADRSSDYVDEAQYQLDSGTSPDVRNVVDLEGSTGGSSGPDHPTGLVSEPRSDGQVPGS
jgi:hypothetical protein